MKTQKTIFAMLSVALTLGALTACDDRPVSFQVDESKTLKSLSSSEKASICEEVQQAFEQAMTQERTCRLTAQSIFSDSSLEAQNTCQANYDSCMAKDFNQNELFPNMKHCSNEYWQKYDQCEVTVGQLEDCMNEAYLTLEQLDSLTCEKGLDDFIYDMNEGSPTCKTIEERCKKDEKTL